ncbi:MAG: hypothetical protein NT027_14165 [Proteobacteria bacterium]|nr:hypothetical protein [Pseudomonadota bacterium]
MRNLNMTFFWFLMFLPIVFIGCTKHRELILDVEVVSMTHANLPKGKKLKPVGNVTTKWCKGDAVAHKTSGTNLGYIDQVTAKAQKMKRADFIMAPRFYLIEGTCMEIKGTAAVIR